MKKRSILPSTAGWVLIPVAVGISCIGKLIAQGLKLPLWLDSIGTILSAALAGPIVGAIGGVLTNVFYGFVFDPSSFPYFITNLAIGIVAGIFAYKGFGAKSWIRSIVNMVLIGLLLAVTSTIVSTPLNIVLYHGTSGNLWGDALFTVLRAHNVPLWLSSALDELVLDIPDKLAMTLVAFLLYKALPKKMLVIFRNDTQVEKLD